MQKKPLSAIEAMLAASLQRPELEKELGDALAAREAERATLESLQHIMKTARMKMEEIRVEDVLDADRGDELDTWHNHGTINRGREVVTVALQQNPAAAQQLAEAINAHGAFFQQYMGETRKRIEGGMHTRTDGGGWKIYAGHGRVRATEAPFDLLPAQPGAHGDFLFPADKDAAELVVPLPTAAHDVIYPLGRQVLDQILADPACAFLIADICAYPHARQKGVAARVEDAAFAHARAMNAAGRKHKLQYGVSAMANVVSVTNEQGEVVWQFDPQMLNIISLVMHTKRATKPGILIGEQRGQKIAEIETDAGKFAINGDWYIAAQRVEEQAPYVAT